MIGTTVARNISTVKNYFKCLELFLMFKSPRTDFSIDVSAEKTLFEVN